MMSSNQEFQKGGLIHSQTITKRQINGVAFQIWRVISEVGGVQHWVPMIRDCHLEGRGVGAYRICLTDMGEIREVINRIDHQEQLFEYSITKQAILPFYQFKGSIKVIELEKQRTEIIWQASYLVLPHQEIKMNQTMDKMFEEAILGLENLTANKII